MPDLRPQSSMPGGHAQQTSTSTGGLRWLKRVLIGAGILVAVGVLTLGGFIVAGFWTIISRVDEREEAYFNPPAGMKVVIKEIEKVPENLKPYFVPFYFHCPEKLKSVPNPETFLTYHDNPDATATEIVAVFPVSPVVTAANWESVFAERMKEISGVYAAKYKNYQELSQAPEQIPYHTECWQMRWQGEELDQSGEAVVTHGRELLVRHDKRSRALQVTMMAIRDPEVQSAHDVGVKGDLASIVKTFRIQDPPHKRSSGRRPGR